MSRVEGIEQFRRTMRMMETEVRDGARLQIEKEATKVAALMRFAAPKNTGALAESIGWTWGDARAGGISARTATSGAVYDFLGVTLQAGGVEGTSREQRRASGTRQRDWKRTGTFSSEKTDVAAYQEFGTSRMPANPFFFPIWRAERRRVRSNIIAAVRRAVRRINASQ